MSVNALGARHLSPCRLSLSPDRLDPDSVSILLVEDDRNIGTVLSILLEDEGFDVSWVTSVRKADEHLTRTDVLVAVIDCRLSDGNGSQLVSRVQELPASRAILMSGATRACERDALRAAGADLHFEKPFVTADFVRGVRDLATAARNKRLALADRTRNGTARVCSSSQPVRTLP